MQATDSNPIQFNSYQSSHPPHHTRLFTPLLSLAHVNNATNAVTSLHVGEGLVDSVEWLPVGDEFVDLELAGHVVVDEVWELGATLDTAEGAALPDAAGDELEC